MGVINHPGKVPQTQSVEVLVPKSFPGHSSKDRGRLAGQAPKNVGWAKGASARNPEARLRMGQ